MDHGCTNVAEIEKAIEETDKKIKEIQAEIRKRKRQAAIKQNQPKAYSKLSDDEQRMVDEALQKYNNQQRRRYGISSDLAGYEFR